MSKQLYVIPSYVCNFTCDWCIQKTRKGNKSKIDLDELKKVIATISNIDRVTLLGGEVSVLPKDYLDELMTILESIEKPIGISTNLFRINPRLLDHNISVSWDMDTRQHTQKVFENIMTLKRCSLATVVTPELMSRDISSIVNFYSVFSNVDFVAFNFFGTTSIAKTVDVDAYVSFLRRLRDAKPKFFVSQFILKNIPEKITIAPPSDENPLLTLDLNNSYHENYGCGDCKMQKYCTLYTPVEDVSKCSYKTFLEELEYEKTII